MRFFHSVKLYVITSLFFLIFEYAILANSNFPLRLLANCVGQLRDPPSFSLSSHEYSNPIHIKTNFGSVFQIEIDGHPHIAKFELGSQVASPDTVVIGEVLYQAGFGVKLVGLIDAPFEEAFEKMGIWNAVPDEDKSFLKELFPETGEIKILEFVKGIEFKFGLEDSSAKLSEPPYDFEKIRKRLLEFGEFCDRIGIEIGADLAFFITADSNIVVFDYDLYKLVPTGSVIESNEIIILQRIESLKSYFGK